MPADCNVGALSNEGTVSGIKGSGPSRGFGSQDDQELAKIVKSIKVNIKIVGCGGSGSNTVNRCMREGIYGTEMIAANTDAKHLLTVAANRKILLGRRATRGLGAGAIPKLYRCRTYLGKQ